MTDPNIVEIQEINTHVTIDQTDISLVLQIEEIKNTVTIDQQDPSLVYVSTVGIQGKDGSSVIPGNGPPLNTIGNYGDIYIDISTGYFWGPKGLTEWPEEPFYAAGLTLRHIFTQAVPSAEWYIPHTLGGYPSVTIVDSSGTAVFGEVLYVSTTEVTVTFAVPFSGFAYLT